MKYSKKQICTAVRAAFPHTIPVLTGYLFLGTAFGVLLQSKGFGVGWAMLMSLTIYAGAMQFVAVGLLAAGFYPLTAAIMTLMVNARHIFYGISMLEKFADMKKLKPYMIFSLTDETYSLLCSVEPPEGCDSRLFRFCIAVFNHGYWIAGGIIGNVLGAAIKFNSRGIDFVMTALFVVIFLEQWLTKKGRFPALIGVGSSIVCLIFFDAQWFLIPAMILLTLLLFLFRGRIEGGRGE